MDQHSHTEIDIKPTPSTRMVSNTNTSPITAATGGSSNILFMGFNQDGTSLAIGTRHGYRLYQLHSADKIELIFESTSEKDVCLVERLFSSSLVALASLNSPRMLKVVHFKKNTEICNYSYSNTVLTVRMNRSRLIVCLEETLYIHNIRNMEVLHTIRDTPSNPHGLCALVPNEECSYLAYPGSSIIGEVQIFDANHLRAVTMLAAHNTTLASMIFDYNGTKLATASDKGTVIRVFAIPSGDKLYEFRRGMRRCVSIYSLGFSADGSLLCSSSNTETLHIFKLDQSSSLLSGGGAGGKQLTKQSSSGDDTGNTSTGSTPSSSSATSAAMTAGGWMMSYLNKAISSTSTYLPTQVAEVINQGRSFAQVRHAVPGIRNTSCIAVMQKVPRLLVVTAEGYLYIYGIDSVEGGDCNLLRQHNLFHIPLSTAGAAAGSSPAHGTATTTGGGGSVDAAAGDRAASMTPLAARQAAELEKQQNSSSSPTTDNNNRRRKSTSSSSSSLNQPNPNSSVTTQPPPSTPSALAKASTSATTTTTVTATVTATGRPIDSSGFSPMTADADLLVAAGRGHDDDDDVDADANAHAAVQHTD